MKSQYYLGVISILLGLCISACPVEAEDALQIIIHSTNNYYRDQGADREEIEKIFSGERAKWPRSDTKIQRVHLPFSSDGHEMFFKEIFGKSFTTWKQEEYKEIFAGRVRGATSTLRPKIAKNEEDMLNEVRHDSGAIGYISRPVEPVRLKTKGVKIFKHDEVE